MSFAGDVKSLFRPIDIQHMKPFGGNLDDYSYMFKPENAKAVYARLTGAVAPVMPPDGKWQQSKLDVFKAWMDGGLSPK